MTPGDMPWGNVQWMVRRSQLRNFHLVGAVSSEDRSFAILNELVKEKVNLTGTFLEIADSHDPERDLGKTRRETFVRQLRQRHPDYSLTKTMLFANEDEIFKIAESIETEATASDGSIFLDISCLPKRFFFPIVKEAAGSESVKNLIVGYSQARSYAQTNLGVDPSPGYALPGFGEPYPTPEQEVIIVGGGFGAPGFLDHFERLYEAGVRVMVLLPFPSDAPRYNRIWQFVRELENSSANGKIETLPTPLHDVGLATSRIRDLTANGEQYGVMMPYGPKTVSLSMCLAAMSLTNSSKPPSIVYAQPTSYVENYSTGVAQVNGKAVTLCYPVKLDGQPRYVGQ